MLLLRKYPKLARVNLPYSQEEIDEVARRLNERPRKTPTTNHLLRNLLSVLRRPIKCAVLSNSLKVSCKLIEAAGAKIVIVRPFAL